MAVRQKIMVVIQIEIARNDTENTGELLMK